MKLAQFISLVSVDAQRGFVKGRHMYDNVFDIESEALAAYAEEKEASGVVAFDIAAAFPSLSHEFLFEALVKYKVPKDIIVLLKALSTDHVVQLKFKGDVHPGFAVLSSIKQGGPASGSLFALALDAYIRMFFLRLPSAVALFRAYADDLVAMLRRLYTNFKSIIKAFRILKEATALEAHPSKIQLVAFGPGASALLVKAWVDSLPAPWNQMVCGGSLKHLGTIVGPEAQHRFWEDGLANYQHATKTLVSLGWAWPS